jgi:hypothetical protein
MIGIAKRRMMFVHYVLKTLNYLINIFGHVNVATRYEK